jgi:flagellar hook-associated protein 1 FlgK
MVNVIGNKAREIDVNFESQSSLLEQAELAVQSLSGVNLDEEAANLLRYQQAYQASAKIIDISGRLFDILASLG